MARAQVIDVTKLSGKQVKFGATVTVIDEDTEEEARYQIVGEHEADIKRGRLALTSPLARGMIGKESGDAVEVSTPSGIKAYEILKVEWGLTTPRLIWAVSDGRAGIDNQVLGLAEAVARQIATDGSPAQIVHKQIGWKAPFDPLPPWINPGQAWGFSSGSSSLRSAVAGPVDRGGAGEPCRCRSAPGNARLALRLWFSCRDPRHASARLRPGGAAPARQADRRQRLSHHRFAARG